LYEPPQAAMPQLSEKPRQGFETWKTTGKPRSNSCNFTVALGLRATVVENGVRETYSARYYNTMTGRFVSMDPESGIITDPKTLHKYEYAGGDPVNAKDPTGRNTIAATGIIIGTIAIPAETAEAALAVAIACVLNKAATTLEVLSQTSGGSATLINLPCATKVQCKPCVPPVGTVSCRIDLTGKPHAGIPTPHWHLYQMNQNPNNCRCFWAEVDGGFGACPAPKGFPPIGPPGGGGPW